MIAGIDRLYQQLAESMNDAIPEEWVTAWMSAVFYREHIAYDGEYAPAEGGKARSFATPEVGERAFEEIRELFRQAGKPVWCRARFELRSDGTFNMNWGYDDCDEDGYARFHEERELERAREQRKKLRE